MPSLYLCWVYCHLLPKVGDQDHSFFFSGLSWSKQTHAYFPRTFFGGLIDPLIIVWLTLTLLFLSNSVNFSYKKFESLFSWKGQFLMFFSYFGFYLSYLITFWLLLDFFWCSFWSFSPLFSLLFAISSRWGTLGTVVKFDHISWHIVQLELWDILRILTGFESTEKRRCPVEKWEKCLGKIYSL